MNGENTESADNSEVATKPVRYQVDASTRRYWITNRIYKSKTNKKITMNKEFIPYEQELEMKDLGFIAEPIIDSWRSLTLYQQAFRWFREKHKINAVIEITIESQWYFSIYNLAAKRNAEIEDTIDYKEGFITYEEAELACLKKLIEIVKNK